MKLELKHIAPYLPYNLKIKITDDSGISFNLEGIEQNNVIYTKHSWYRNGTNIEKCKPILRPLSDLTELIEINCKKIIPIDWLSFKYPDIEFFTDDDSIQLNCSHTDCTGKKYNSFELIDVIEVYQKLLEWHFDVFGLIEQGLAIDINTLEL